MKKFLTLLLVVVGPFAHAQKFAESKEDARLRSVVAEAAAQDAIRLSKLPRSLVHGKILSVATDGYLVSCDAAMISHPTMPSIAVDVRPSQDRLIWIVREPSARVPNYGEGMAVTLLGKEDGTHTYTTVLHRENTVANFRAVEMPTAYSVVTMLDRNGKPETKVAAERGTAQTPELTLKRGW